MQATQKTAHSDYSLAPAVDKVATGLHDAVDAVAGAAAHAVKSVDKKSALIAAAQRRYADECRGYVRDKPLAALGIAVAAGFLISTLLRLR